MKLKRTSVLRYFVLVSVDVMLASRRATFNSPHVNFWRIPRIEKILTSEKISDQ